MNDPQNRLLFWLCVMAFLPTWGLADPCPACGFKNSPEDRYCLECAQELLPLSDLKQEQERKKNLQLFYQRTKETSRTVKNQAQNIKNKKQKYAQYLKQKKAREETEKLQEESSAPKTVRWKKSG